MLSARRLAGPAIGLAILTVIAFGLITAVSAQDSTNDEQMVMDDAEASPSAGVSLAPAEAWSCIRAQPELTALLMDDLGAVGDGRIEFILNRFPAAVGDIVEVGGKSPTKVTNAFATVHTSANGEATVTLVATRPGDTDVTAFAPGIKDASVHKAFGVVHWVDGCPQFPGDADNPTGTSHPMSVSVLRVSDGSPVQGVPVRWTITDDGPDARFANASGDGNAITISSDASGLSSVSLEQVTENIGENTVLIEALTQDGRTMFSHTMVKRWKAPILTVSATGPDTIGLLGEATYEITVSNTGDFPATESVLTMELPDGLRFVSATDDGEVSGEAPDQVATWNLGTIDVEGSVSVSLTAQGVLTGLQTSMLGITSAEGFGQRTTTETTVIPGALTVTKTGPAEVALGSQATFYIQVLSTGTGANTQVEVVDTLPAGMSFVSANMASTQDGNEVSVDLGTLNPDEQTTVEIVVTADEAGAWVNQATATSEEGASDSSEVTTTVIQPILDIAKAGPETALLNTDFDYTITVTNTGDGAALGTTVVDTLPAGLEAVDSSPPSTVSGSTVTWDIGTIGPADSVTISFTTKGVAGGAQENVVTASSDGSTFQPEAKATTIILVPNIAVAKTGRSAMFIGNQATFTLTASNTGSAPLTEVTITENIATSMTYVSSSPEGTVSADGSQVVWNVGTLAPDGEVSVSVTLKAEEEGTVTNTATAGAAEDVTATSSIDVLVLPAPGAHIQISDSSDPVTVGEQVEFNVLVSNQGRSDMTGVQFSVSIPDAMTVVSTSSDQATVSEDGRTVSLGLTSPVAAGGSFAFTITVQANELPEGTNRVDAVTTAVLSYNEFSAPLSADEGTTVIER